MFIFLLGGSTCQVSSVQLRDDLLSMLVAGHETTGSVLTWTLYLLSKVPFYSSSVYLVFFLNDNALTISSYDLLEQYLKLPARFDCKISFNFSITLRSCCCVFYFYRVTWKLIMRLGLMMVIHCFGFPFFTLN